MQNKCCCLPTEKAFLLIVYLDISRIIWGTITCAFMFQRESSLSLVITILDIILIVFQSSLALYINMRALKQNNKKPIYIYRKLKLLFVFCNTFDRLVAPIINCTLIFKDDQKEARSDYCVVDVFVAIIITAIIWNFIEYYFYTIVKDFVLILQRSGKVGRINNHYLDNFQLYFLTLFQIIDHSVIQKIISNKIKLCFYAIKILIFIEYIIIKQLRIETNLKLTISHQRKATLVIWQLCMKLQA